MITKANGKPDSTQYGNVGDIYLDLETGNTYKCVEVKTGVLDYGFVDITTPKNEYVWEPVADIGWVDASELPEEGWSFGYMSAPYFSPYVTFIRIPYGATAISGGCLSSGAGWPNLKSLYIPDTVTRIGGGSLSTCQSIKELTIPGSVQTFEGGWLPPNLEKLVLEDGITQLSGGFFSGVNTGSIKEFAFPKTLKNISDGTFSAANPMSPSIKNIELPDGLERIGAYGFTFPGVSYLSIPGSVAEINGTAIQYCPALEKVDIQSGLLLAIPGQMFLECPALAEINIPNNVETIHEDAFLNCTGLTTINIDAEEGSVEGAPWGAPDTATINWLR